MIDEIFNLGFFTQIILLASFFSIGYLLLRLVNALITLIISPFRRKLIPTNGIKDRSCRRQPLAEFLKNLSIENTSWYVHQQNHQIGSSQPTLQTQNQNSVSLKSLIKSSQKQRNSSATDLSNSPLFMITLKGCSELTTGLSWSSNGKYLATASEDRTVRVYDLSNDISAKSPPYKHFEMRCSTLDVAFASCESTSQLAVLTSGLGGIAGISLIDVSTPQSKANAPTSAIQSQISTLFPSRDATGLCMKGSQTSKVNSPILVAASKRTDVVAYRIADNTGTDSPFTLLGKFDTGGFVNFDISVSNNGRFIAAATFASDVKIYETQFDRSGACLGVKKVMDLKGHKKKITAVDFSDDGTKAVTASEDGTLRIWNIDVRYSLQEDPKAFIVTGLPSGNKPITKLAWGCQGRMIAAVAGSDVYILDAQNAKVVDMIVGAHKGDIVDLSWSSARLKGEQGNVSVFATCGNDGRVRLWKAPDA